MSDLVISRIRTIVPMIVGAFIAWLASRGIELDATAAANLVSFLTALFSAVYYLLARWLEQRFTWAGWLLGSKKQPSYNE